MPRKIGQFSVSQPAQAEVFGVYMSEGTNSRCLQLGGAAGYCAATCGRCVPLHKSHSILFRWSAAFLKMICD